MTLGPTDDTLRRAASGGAETRELGRARLRKYVVTDQQQVTVPVRRAEA